MIYRNNSNQKLYKVTDTLVIDSTNGRDGNYHMYLYKDVRGQKFVRDSEEFKLKFTKTDLKKFPK